MYSSHIINMNLKPFNTKTVGEMKKRILTLFRMIERVDGKYFVKYGERIANALAMPFQTETDKQNVFDNLSDLVSSILV